jgi:hypothetical protein
MISVFGYEPSIFKTVYSRNLTSYMYKLPSDERTSTQPFINCKVYYSSGTQNMKITTSKTRIIARQQM